MLKVLLYDNRQTLLKYVGDQADLHQDPILITPDPSSADHLRWQMISKSKRRLDAITISRFLKDQLFSELKKRKVKSGLGVILKIETQRGFNNLTEILLVGMQLFPIGVMIARGDLAVECGWRNIGWVQKEILSLCLAAHVTDIWATQVLKTWRNEVFLRGQKLQM